MVPAIQQFFNWLWDVVRLDLGDSFFLNDSVANIIGRQLAHLSGAGRHHPDSGQPDLHSPRPVLCAHQDSISDYVVRIISVILMVHPHVLAGHAGAVLPRPVVGLRAAGAVRRFFKDPLTNLQMFLVPSILGALAQAGMQLRIVRTMVLDTLRQDYIRTAYAKGVKQKRVLFHHAFRNAMIPVITVIGGSVAALVGGNVILESIFNIPGIGNSLVTALGQRDFPMVQGCVLVMSIFVMLVNLIIDITYKWIDPRVTFE